MFASRNASRVLENFNDEFQSWERITEWARAEFYLNKDLNLVCFVCGVSSSKQLPRNTKPKSLHKGRKHLCAFVSNFRTGNIPAPRELGRQPEVDTEAIKELIMEGSEPQQHSKVNIEPESFREFEKREASVIDYSDLCEIPFQGLYIENGQIKYCPFKLQLCKNTSVLKDYKYYKEEFT